MWLLFSLLSVLDTNDPNHSLYLLKLDRNDRSEIGKFRHNFKWLKNNKNIVGMPSAIGKLHINNNVNIRFYYERQCKRIVNRWLIASAICCYGK